MTTGPSTPASTTSTACSRSPPPNSGAVFADPRPAFSGHELCDGSGWLNSLTIPVGNSYHPTATGQASGYLPTFSAAA